MGFFSDLKEDLSQAVDEMLPEETASEESVVAEEVTEAETVAEMDLATVPQAEAEPEKKADKKDKKNNNKGDFTMDSYQEVLDETAIITRGMTVSGDIKSQGSLDVLGSVFGNIDVLGKLNISGSVQGDSAASEIFADSARISGDVKSSGSIKIGQSSVIIGNISATSAVVAGAVKGDIDVKGPVILDSSAIVMGNIKSKSVQINNGAVIEGMCSQCYAEVNPSAFFNEYKK